MDSSDQGKLFIGGVSWETTEDKLKDYFKPYGEVVEAVIMKDRATGRARGFGFVVFADPSVADRILQEKHTIDGRVVEAKKAVPRDEQQNFPRISSGNQVSGGQIRTKKIFVGGLASTVTEDVFKKYFEQFGNITDVVVMYDHNTQRPRGFGFITFDTEDAVDKVLQKTFHELNEKMVEVKRAVPKELSAGLTGGRTSAGGFGVGGGRGLPFNSAYGQGYSTSPGSAYGANRYGPAVTGRGGFPSYGPSGYGAAAYGAGFGYGAAMNGGYGLSGYGGAPRYGAPAGYGGGYSSNPAATGYGGAAGYGSTMVASGGFGSASIGARSPWGNTDTAFAGGGSPAGYGSPVGGMAGYVTAGWGAGGATGGATAYGNGTYGYGGGEPGYSSAPYGTRGGSSGYGDGYTGSAYGDSTWRSGGDSRASPGAASGSVASGVFVGDTTATDGMANGTGNLGTGYGLAGRQAQRAPDTRFRPYTGAGERAAT